MNNNQPTGRVSPRHPEKSAWYLLIRKTIPTLAILAVTAVALLHTYRLFCAAWNFEKDSPQSVQTAVDYSPGNAEYRVRLASFLGTDGLPQIKLAIQQNPTEAMWWIEASVLEEIRGDMTEAERSLHRAAEVSRHFLPRMMLASYYNRRRDLPLYKHWAREALSIGNNPPPLLAEMGWQLGMTPAEFATEIVPNGVAPLAMFLEELLAVSVSADSERAAAGQDELVNIAARLLEIGSDANVDELLRTVERLHSVHRSGAAVALWNKIADRHWIDRAKLEYGNPGTLKLWDRGLPGYDWKTFATDGVMESEMADGGLRLAFSGQQPEHVRLLSRRIALAPDTEYRLSAHGNSDENAPAAGLAWKVLDESTTVVTLAAVTHQDQRQAEFQTAHAPHDYILELWYDRQPGTTRISATVALQTVAVTRLP